MVSSHLTGSDHSDIHSDPLVNWQCRHVPVLLQIVTDKPGDSVSLRQVLCETGQEEPAIFSFEHRLLMDRNRVMDRCPNTVPLQHPGKFIPAHSVITGSTLIAILVEDMST